MFIENGLRVYVKKYVHKFVRLVHNGLLRTLYLSNKQEQKQLFASPNPVVKTICGLCFREMT